MSHDYRKSIAQFLIMAKRSYPSYFKDYRLVNANIYGVLSKNNNAEMYQYVCHSYLGRSCDISRDAIIIGAIYNSSPAVNNTFSYDDQAKYFEYIADPETSPWGEIIKELDIEYIRNEDGHILWVIVKSLDINRYFLFHFLKGFRQVYEKKDAIRIFTETLKTSDDPKEHYRAFLLAHLFYGSGPISLGFGGDHHALRGLPTRSLLDRSPLDFQNLKKEDLYSRAPYYYGRNMSEILWDQGVVKAKLFLSIHTPALQRLLSKTAGVYGYFLKNPHSESLNSFDVKQVLKRKEVLYEYIREQTGLKDF